MWEEEANEGTGGGPVAGEETMDSGGLRCERNARSRPAGAPEVGEPTEGTGRVTRPLESGQAVSGKVCDDRRMGTASEPAGPVRRAPTAAEARALGHPTRLRILLACRDAPPEDGEGSARERWNERYRDRAARAEPDPFVLERLPLLPRSGRALDLAGGGGRHAIVLAGHGLDVTLIDVSDVACAAVRARARAAGVDVEVIRRRLLPETLPPGPFAAVVAHHYLDVAVWQAAVLALAPGGVALLSQPTVRNLERHPRPGRRWLLEEGRMHELVEAWRARRPGLAVVEVTEGWTGEGHHEARAVLRQRSG